VALTKRAIELLSAMPEIRIYGPKDTARRGGVVSFNVEGLHAHDVGTARSTPGRNRRSARATTAASRS